MLNNKIIKKTELTAKNSSCFNYQNVDNDVKIRIYNGQIYYKSLPLHLFNIFNQLLCFDSLKRSMLQEINNDENHKNSI